MRWNALKEIPKLQDKVFLFFSLKLTFHGMCLRLRWITSLSLCQWDSAQNNADEAGSHVPTAAENLQDSTDKPKKSTLAIKEYRLTTHYRANHLHGKTWFRVIRKGGSSTNVLLVTPSWNDTAELARTSEAMKIPFQSWSPDTSKAEVLSNWSKKLKKWNQTNFFLKQTKGEQQRSVVDLRSSMHVWLMIWAWDELQRLRLWSVMLRFLCDEGA